MNASKINLYEFSNYKNYLRGWISLRSRAGRGEKSRLAEHIGCQLAYISQVLNGDANFSLEQAESLNEFLEHTEDDSEYFNLLVQAARAGTEKLKIRIQAQIKRILDKRLLLQNRLDFEKVLTLEDQLIYYSAWYYSAIHVALSIPSLRTRKSIAKALGLPTPLVDKVLELLTKTGLASEGAGKFTIGNARIHLESTSPMISKHHTNWRMECIKSLDLVSAQDLHYSSVITLAEKDVSAVREILIQAIQRVRETIRPSEDEILYAYSIDLFELLEMR